MKNRLIILSTIVVMVLLTFGSTNLFASPDYTFVTNGTIQAADTFHDVFVDNCTVDMIGGFVENELSIYNSGTVNFYGGKTYNQVHVHDSSILNVFDDTDGGWGLNGITSYDTSEINITGGYIVNDVIAGGDSIVNISDGLVHEIDTFDNSEIHVYGGEVIFFSGSGSSTMNIYGYDFQYIPDGSIYSGHHLLTGFFEDGTEFNINIYNQSQADLSYDHIVTHVIPEPTTLLLLGLGKVMLRRKR